MTSLAHAADEANTVSNPLDLVEQIVAANEWNFDRRSDSDLAAEAQGKWCDYGLYFCWSDEISIMHFSATFDMKAPAKRRGTVYELLAKANERLWIGHFGLDAETDMPVYRHAMLLRGAPGVAAESVEDMIDIALTECERFFPAFQFAIWGGKSPDEALDAAMLECAGEA
ncbi:YbjN domain-containing protein [Acidocella sp.]|jgi:hypothetical protein|uniref:YbjN domain-containing protein n=1 Tax=Acidocella sp. TaxID=50710 RepID=UPI0026266F01|nr:YbjN domain-containing protein [Acidocella sp.]